MLDLTSSERIATCMITESGRSHAARVEGVQMYWVQRVLPNKIHMLCGIDSFGAHR